ncbi:hypothetical protein [Cerasicoccus fimbriatus]|uniref:hypothetical protein n=1 Tax=Cerasicoccus fimbriatus TaxID=3014554 RepID=UPI0022B59541|nr:hypothetical protein [Cerasicoccus sp. TK19100]
MKKLLLLTLGITSFSTCAFGALTLDFSQVGPDVHITATGTLDVTGLTLVDDNYGGSPTGAFTNSIAEAQAAGMARPGDDYYTLPIALPIFSFVDNYSYVGTAGISDSFFYFYEQALSQTTIFVPDGFTSGPINSLVVLPNVDLTTMNVLPFSGLSWGAGPGQSLSVTSSSAIPETSTYLAMFGFAALGVFIWRRRKINCQRSKATAICR